MISINYKDSRPIYEQIVSEFKKQILAGVIAPDEKMPSVRELATQLAINPNTIQRAYRELEASGCIYSVPGKGNFACENREISSRRKAELAAALQKAAEELRILGVSEAELLKYLERRNSND